MWLARTLVAEEDNDPTVQSVSAMLRREGIAMERAASGMAALEKARTGYDLILMDVMLPELDGFEVCRKLRAERIDVPILLLTARSDDRDQILGLGLGADDVIVKTVSAIMLAARVKAHLRRYLRIQQAAGGTREDVLRFPGLVINRSGHRVSRDGVDISLTAREFGLLWYLASREGKPTTREQIFREVWGDNYYRNCDDSTVLVHIRRLRAKLEPDPSMPRYIETVGRSLGYRFRAPR